MANMIKLTIVALISLYLYSCSNLDQTTNLGSDIVKDMNPFDAQKHSDSLQLSNMASFIETSGKTITDTSRRSISGVVPHFRYAVGRWNNERFYSYIKFDGDSLKKWFDSSSATGNRILSLYLSVTATPGLNDFIKGTVQLGMATNKDSVEKLTPDDFENILSTKELCSTDSSYFSMRLPSNLISTKDSIILDTAVTRTTIRTGKVTVYYHDTTVVDTIDVIPSELEAVYGDSAFVSDTITVNSVVQYVVSNISPSVFLKKDTTLIDTTVTVYDTITPFSDMIDSTDIFANITDSVSFTDSSDSTVKIVYDTVTISNITSSDTIHSGTTVSIITFDTTTNTIFQTAKIKKEYSIVTKLNNSAFFDTLATNDSVEILKNVCFYMALDSSKTDSLQIFSNTTLNIKYLKLNKTDSTYDTLVNSLSPRYFDYSAIENQLSDDSAILDASSGRFAVVELDVSNLWNSVRDSSGVVNFLNIPMGDVDLKIKSCQVGPATPDSLRLRFNISEEPFQTIDFLDGYYYTDDFVPASENFTDKTVSFNINKQLIDLLYKYKNTPQNLPNKIYMYIWEHSGYFFRMSLQQENQTTAVFNYIISNTK